MLKVEDSEQVMERDQAVWDNAKERLAESQLNVVLAARCEYPKTINRMHTMPLKQ